MQLRINKSFLPPDRLDDPRVAEFEKKIQSLDKIQWRNICIHESGHALYWRKFGYEVEFYGPSITYTGKDFVTDCAAVRIDRARWEEHAEFELMDFARIHAAGPIATKALVSVDANDPDPWGELGDLESFILQVKRFEATPQEIASAWKQAKDDVIKDLCSPSLCQQIFDEARLFMKKLEDGTYL